MSYDDWKTTTRTTTAASFAAWPRGNVVAGGSQTNALVNAGAAGATPTPNMNV